MPIPLLPEKTTTTDPTATPVSAQTTGITFPIYRPLPQTPAGAGPSTGVVGRLENLLNSPTQPTIWITTTQSSSTVNGVTLKFDYLPESVTFGVTANFEPQVVPYTSARRLVYQNTDIDEVTLTIKVVAGCNNCITYFQGKTMGSDYLNFGNLVSSKFERVSLINLAKLLYALPLPRDYDYPPYPPPTCRLTVARMFSAPGAVTGCNITFNGPYDYDGSPTDMDVSLRFMPSEFYNSDLKETFGAVPEYEPISSPTGESQVTGGYPYALTFGDTPINPAPGWTPSPAALSVAEEQARQFANQPTPEQIAKAWAGTPTGMNIRIGPTSVTPTDSEVADAYGVPLNQVQHDKPPSDNYTVGGVRRTGDDVRAHVLQHQQQQAFQ